MTTTDVSTLIESIRSTRDKLEAEIQPQRDAIAETEAEIDRLNAMLAAYEGKAETPKVSSRNGSQPDDKTTITEAMVRKAHKELVKQTADNENPHADELTGHFYKSDYADVLKVTRQNKSLTDTLKALVDKSEWETTGKRAGMRYGPKA